MTHKHVLGSVRIQGSQIHAELLPIHEQCLLQAEALLEIVDIGSTLLERGVLEDFLV
jgi:hypothetical protein